ncbi:MAG TPA: glycoside hydrolase domain-containing protein [Nocardioidaceae bacterium]|nr:glycoside hydrolase domain-containing protein [Nocardioidaceae bacterium]
MRPSHLSTFLIGLAGLSLVAGPSLAAPPPATSPSKPVVAANPVTPGSLTGYGFDQCSAPSQSAMNAWLTGSPYWAVGIYISGDSRGCTSQPNLSPTWVRMQLAHGWRLLPITLGPQAWCTTRERYLHQVRISPRSTAAYATARAQGRAEANKTVGVAVRLGIARRSTLWYDLEAFPSAGTPCRESALSFLSAWTTQLHRHGFVSGVYSSAASGLAMLDNARVSRPGRYRMPDAVWIADWNGRPDDSSSYVRGTGWTPHRRVHQYRGGHDETYGGVTINVDQDWVDLGAGSTVAAEPSHCGGAAVYDYAGYAPVALGARGAQVRTLQCLLRGKRLYHGPVDGVYGGRLGAAVRSYRVSRGLPASTSTTTSTWVALLSDAGANPRLKVGSASTAVRRVQRALNAADAAGLRVSGVFDSRTTAAVKRYQREHGLSRTGVVAVATWRRLLAGTA